MRVAVPIEREAPAWLVEQLRGVDPTVALVYMGEGRWWLGTVTTPNRHRYRTGMRLLKRTRRSAHRDPWLYRQALLTCQGFVLIAEYAGEPSGAWVDDFARRDHEWRYQSAKDQYLVEEAHEEGRDQRIQARAQGLLDAQGRDIHRSQVRGRIVVPVTRGLTS
jgi:hypothetical protein